MASKASGSAVPARRRFLLGALLTGVLVALVGAASATAASERAIRLWSQAIRSTAVPAAGCFRASYPAVAWKKARCTAAPPFRSPPSRRALIGEAFGSSPLAPSTSGNGNSYSAEVPSGTITSAVGSIPSVSPGATEEDEGTSEKLELQLNSEFFTGSPACGKVSGCLAWQQFLYPALYNKVYMEYWLIHYLPGGGKCPGGFHEFEKEDCYEVSSATALPGGSLTVSKLAGTTFEGRANSEGLDSVVMITGSGSAVATGAANVLDLDNAWKIAEFGVFGEFNGTKANFSPNTTMTVNTGVRSSTLSDAAPICVPTSYTAESNNLTGEGTPSLSPQPFPAISSQQTNGTATPTSCATYGINPPSVTITTPPNGAAYGYGQVVDAEYSCKAAEGATLRSCTGTVPDGTPISTTTGPTDKFSVTAEDTDGQKETVTHTYTVTEAPKATIESPATGGTYKEGEVVPTKFSCKEGEFGPGLESCTDSNGATSGVGALDTTFGLGPASYEVTARSTDGKSATASIEYTVVTACNSARGYGSVGGLANSFSDELSKSPGAKESFEASIQKSALGTVRMTKLSSATCLVIPGGLEYRGQGPATAKGVGGYEVAFAFAVAGSHITLSIEVTKGLTLEYKETNAKAVAGSVEKLS